MQLIDHVSQLFELHFSFPLQHQHTFRLRLVCRACRAGSGSATIGRFASEAGYALDCADARKTLIVAKSP
jgi:hypothetical protein